MSEQKSVLKNMSESIQWQADEHFDILAQMIYLNDELKQMVEVRDRLYAMLFLNVDRNNEERVTMPLALISTLDYFLNKLLPNNFDGETVRNKISDLPWERLEWLAGEINDHITQMDEQILLLTSQTKKLAAMFTAASKRLSLLEPCNDQHAALTKVTLIADTELCVRTAREQLTSSFAAFAFFSEVEKIHETDRYRSHVYFPLVKLIKDKENPYGYKSYYLGLYIEKLRDTLKYVGNNYQSLHLLMRDDICFLLNSQIMEVNEMIHMAREEAYDWLLNFYTEMAKVNPEEAFDSY